MSQSSPIVLSATPPPEAASEASASESDGTVGPTVMDTGTNVHIVNAVGSANYRNSLLAYSTSNRSGTVALAPNACPEHTNPELVRKTCPKYHK
jgi:hypothetical protein